MNIEKRDIEKILETAVYAPSGDNTQPWRFEVLGQEVRVFNMPERDQTLYNFKQRGSLIAHGALIENIKIAASHHGFDTAISLFPDKDDKNLIATVFLEKTGLAGDPLYPFIKQRATNRKPYKKELLSGRQKTELLGNLPSGGRVFLFEGEKDKKILAKAASKNEQILFENPILHQSFFRQIIWTEKEEKEKKRGLYLKTLELPPPARLAFHLFKYWSVLRVFNKLGLSRSVAKTNAAIYASSAAIGAIVIPNRFDEDFVRAGQILQKLWLKTTASGLSLQILAGLIFLFQRMEEEEAHMFSNAHVNLIKNAYNEIDEVVDSGGETIALLFRIGRADFPSARSSRLPPEIALV